MRIIGKRLRYVSIAAIFAATMSITSLLAFPQTALAFAGGDGSWEDPYKIANCTQLQQVYNFDDYNNFFDKSYIVTANINCAAVEEFFPLYDNNEYVFSGNFDGQGFTISNLNISGSDYQAGLFGYSYGATFKNLKLNNVTVDHAGSDEAGALVGYATNTTIEDVYASNINISGKGSIGGLVGALVATAGGESEVYRTSAKGSITGTDANTGGLIGRVHTDLDSYAEVSESYTEVDITSTGAHVGGLIGSITADNEEEYGLSWTRIQDTYAWADIAASDSDNVGGLIGSLTREGDGETRITVRQSYAWSRDGIVSGDFTVGGLIGLIRASDGDGWYAVEENFALAKVAGNGNVGGLVGANNAAENQLDAYFNHYDIEFADVFVCDSGETLTDDIEDGYFACMPVNGENSQVDYFINNYSNAPMNEWDFDDDRIWKTQEDTPPVFYNFVSDPEDGEDPTGDNQDSDGVSSEIEDAAPNFGDANGDGVADSLQSNVASFINSNNGEYLTVALDDDCELTSASNAGESGFIKDAAYEYRFGLVNFSANCGASSTTVSIYQYGISTDGLILRKHNPDTSVYFTIENATIGYQAINGQQVVVATYTIEDNGPLDLDPDNGSITDPVGLANQVVGAPNTGLDRKYR